MLEAFAASEFQDIYFFCLRDRDPDSRAPILHRDGRWNDETTTLGLESMCQHQFTKFDKSVHVMTHQTQNMESRNHMVQSLPLAAHSPFLVISMAFACPKKKRL